MLHGVGYAFVVGRAAFERASRMLGDRGKIGMLPSKLRISEWPSSAICPLCPWGYHAAAVQQRNDAMEKNADGAAYKYCQRQIRRKSQNRAEGPRSISVTRSIGTMRRSRERYGILKASAYLFYSKAFGLSLPQSPN